MDDHQRAPHEYPGAEEPRPPRSGTEPRHARSDLPLRLLLSAIFVPVFALCTVGFAVWWANSGADSNPSDAELRVLALGCGALTVIAAIDLAVVRRRLSRRDKG